jgi:hypothetical protein
MRGAPDENAVRLPDDGTAREAEREGEDMIGTDMTDQEPMYSCRHQGCAEEFSYNADMLRHHPDGGLVCETCWQHEDGADWNELPEVVSHKEQCAALETEVALYKQQWEGACKYGAEADRAADRIAARAKAMEDVVKAAQAETMAEDLFDCQTYARDGSVLILDPTCGVSDAKKKRRAAVRALTHIDKQEQSDGM